MTTPQHNTEDERIDALLLTLMGAGDLEDDRRIFREDVSYVEAKAQLQQLLREARIDELGNVARMLPEVNENAQINSNWFIVYKILPRQQEIMSLQKSGDDQ